MIRLNLSNRPEWLDLLPGLRVLVAPLTTALMVSARADPAIDTLSEASSREDMALAMAKAVARRAVLETGVDPATIKGTGKDGAQIATDLRGLRLAA